MGGKTLWNKVRRSVPGSASRSRKSFFKACWKGDLPEVEKHGDEDPTEPSFDWAEPELHKGEVPPFMRRGVFFSGMSLAARAGQDGVVEYLVVKGADVDGGKGEPPLVAAVLRERESTVRILLTVLGADPHHVYRYPEEGLSGACTAVHRSVEHGLAGMQAILFECGANANALDYYGRPPWQCLLGGKGLPDADVGGALWEYADRAWRNGQEVDFCHPHVSKGKVEREEGQVRTWRTQLLPESKAWLALRVPVKY